MKKVLLTGANGLIGSLVREQLAGRYDFRYLTHRPADFPSVVADIADLDAIAPAFEGMDAVVHLAAASSPASAWDEVVADNIIGSYNIFEAARRASVGCVIFTSSNHAVSGYEMEAGPSLYDLDDPRMIDEHAEIRPDSYYGISKAAAEATGRYYSDVHGVRAFMLRIGWVMREDDPLGADVSHETVPPLTPEQTRARARAIFLSQRDCVELIRCCLDADAVKFGIYYGISNNPRQFYDLSNARRDLGYAPQDSAPRELTPTSA
jgi:nucleoside-diphosphate-sugar epimerase